MGVVLHKIHRVHYRIELEAGEQLERGLLRVGGKSEPADFAFVAGFDERLHHPVWTEGLLHIRGG